MDIFFPFFFFFSKSFRGAFITHASHVFGFVGYAPRRGTYNSSMTTANKRRGSGASAPLLFLSLSLDDHKTRAG